MCPPVVDEKTKRDNARAELANKMLSEVKKAPKKDIGIAAGGLDLRFYQVERIDELALVSFDIENTTKTVIDLENPQITLITAAEKGKERKKSPVAKAEPVELVQSELSAKAAAARRTGYVSDRIQAPVHDSDQQVVLSVANRAMADQPAAYRIE